MNSTLIKVYGLFAVASLTAFILTGQLAQAQSNDFALDQRDQTRVINLAANMTNRAEAMGKRITDINDRLNSGYTWIKTNREANLPQFEENYLAVNNFVFLNQTILNTIDQDIYSAVTSNNPKQNWNIVKNTYLQMQDNLSQALGFLEENLFILNEENNLWFSSSTPATVEAVETPALNTSASSTNL